MKRTALLLLATALLGIAYVGAQPVPAGDARTVVLDPTAIDTVTVRWEGRMLSSDTDDHSVTIAPAGPLRRPDAVPNGITTGLSVSGNDLNITLAPGTDCGSPANCRAGNAYQVRVQVEDTNGNRPVFNFLLRVRAEVLS